MDKTFDELFDDFLKKYNRKSGKNDGVSTSFDAKKLINLLDKISILDNVDEDIEKSLDISLGDPDKIEYYMENDLYCEKRSWNTPNGTLVKLTMSDIPIQDANEEIQQNKYKEMTLEEQLEEAIKKEDYELAGKLRDEIENTKKDN